jgi:hypothetical protein
VCRGERILGRHCTRQLIVSGRGDNRREEGLCVQVLLMASHAPVAASLLLDSQQEFTDFLAKPAVAAPPKADYGEGY